MCDCDCPLPKRERWDRIKRAYAHELAEKIRATPVGDLPSVNDPGHMVRFGFNRAADLIDPEVE